MTGHSFSLIPFPDPAIPEIKITGSIVRQNNLLTIHYSISGDTADILFPDKSSRATRKDELWTATCFEFFLARPVESQYWEFNMSPSGNWNVYHMDAYRRVGFREERSIRRLPFDTKIDAGCVSMDAAVDLSPIIQGETLLQVGITSVIQTRDQYETYWALVHPNPQADFHLKDSFIIQV